MIDDSNYGQQAVPKHARKSLISLTFIMLGLTFFSASMMAGGEIASHLRLTTFFWAIGAGNLLLGGYTACLGYIGAKTGLTTHLLTRFSFGVKGSWLPSFLLSATQIGWFGVGLAMFALPVAKVLGCDSYWLIGIFGVLMTASIACEGILALTILSVIAVPAITILGCYSVWLAVHDAGGLMVILHQSSPTYTMSFSKALAIVVGSFISAGTLTADFVRFGKSARSAVIVAMIAFFLGNSLMFIFGGAGAAALGLSDISDVMFAQGLLIPAIIVLGLNIWTTNNNALYASGLGFANITGLSSKKLSLFNGLVGTVASLWLYNNFVSWLTFLSAAIPPIGGVIIVDYLLHRKHYQQLDKMQFKMVNPLAIVAIFIGVMGAQILPGVVPVNSVLCSAFSYAVLTIVSSRLGYGVLKQDKVSYAE